MSGLVSYGGDPSVTVARSEIERITNSLANIQTRLTDELQPLAQLTGIVHHLQLDAHLPETLVRLGLQRHGCFVASESYFSGDARVAHQLDAVSSTIHANPWLQKLVPAEVWAGLAAGVGISAFTNNNITSLGVRTTVGQLPVETLSTAVSKMPSSEIQISERPPSAVYQKPLGIAGLAGRLNNKSGHIRIESYGTANGRVVVMYLPGTAEWNPLRHEKAFDVRSDLELLARGENTTSYRAANAALDAFGVTSNDRLILVGYSQGGMVAAELAQHHPNVAGLVTLGSPIAKESLPTNVPVISIEHSNDVVPALSGATNPLTENWVTATRHIDVHSGETVLKAHNIGEYVQTAALADTSVDSGLVRLRGVVLDQLNGAELQEEKEYAAFKATS